MKRYYSHYTFIYPDIYLKNHIVELDDEDRIIKTFPFEREVEKTEFYSGLLVFCPVEFEAENQIEHIINRLYDNLSISITHKDVSKLETNIIYILL